jgi:hypothetical protein
MPSYTPLPIPFSYHIEGYGLHNATVDGLLIARAIVKDSCIDFNDEVRILRDIDAKIEQAKQLT